MGLEYSSPPRTGTQNYHRGVSNATYAPPWGPVTPMLPRERGGKTPPTGGEKFSVGTRSVSSVGGKTGKRRWSAVARPGADRGGVMGEKFGGVVEDTVGGRWGGEWGSSVDFRLHQHVERFFRRGGGSIADARQLAQLLQVSRRLIRHHFFLEGSHLT